MLNHFTFRYKAQILLLLLILPLPGSSVAQSRSAQTTYSITAAELLQYFATQDVRPQLTVLYDDGTRRTLNPKKKGICTFSSVGVLEVRTPKTTQGRHPEWCEFVLFSPASRLRLGWLVRRIHWSGDIRNSRFLNNPTNVDSLYIRVRIRIPSAKIRKKIAVRRLKLRLVTLLGPLGQRWQRALSQ